MFKYTTEHNELTVWQKGHHQKRAYAFFIKDSRDIQRERTLNISPPNTTVSKNNCKWPHRLTALQSTKTTQIHAIRRTHIYTLLYVYMFNVILIIAHNLTQSVLMEGLQDTHTHIDMNIIETFTLTHTHTYIQRHLKNLPVGVYNCVVCGFVKRI